MDMENTSQLMNWIERNACRLRPSGEGPQSWFNAGVDGELGVRHCEQTTKRESTIPKGWRLGLDNFHFVGITKNTYLSGALQAWQRDDQWHFSDTPCWESTYNQPYSPYVVVFYQKASFRLQREKKYNSGSLPGPSQSLVGSFNPKTSSRNPTVSILIYTVR